MQLAAWSNNCGPSEAATATAAIAGGHLRRVRSKAQQFVALRRGSARRLLLLLRTAANWLITRLKRLQSREPFWPPANCQSAACRLPANTQILHTHRNTGRMRNLHAAQALGKISKFAINVDGTFFIHLLCFCCICVCVCVCVCCATCIELVYFSAIIASHCSFLTIPIPPFPTSP